jgi:hypothetical protein
MKRLLDSATALRSDWSLPPSINRTVRYDLEDLAGQVSTPAIDDLVHFAETDTFSTFAALALFRSPLDHPLDAPYMERVFSAACSPARFDCNRMGPPASDPMEERTLTRKVNGPVLLADLLLKRAEMLVGRADANPAMAMPALGEAMGRLQAAAGILLSAQLNTQVSDLPIYPALDGLDPRQERIDQVKAAVAARLAGPSAHPLPDPNAYYRSKPFLAAYQCGACHVPQPGVAVPK